MSRLIPPVLVILLLAALAALWAWHPGSMQMRTDRAMPWDVPLILGLTILVWARVHFVKRNAEVHTFKTPRTLVDDGPFRFSRNPMYLGFFLILVAAAFYVNHWCALLAPAVFLKAAMYWYIPHEEGVLRTSFGGLYDVYASKVRRWV